MKFVLSCCFLFFSVNSVYSQTLKKINLLVPSRNIRSTRKLPVFINDHRFLMKEGTYSGVSVYADTAKLSFSTPDWKLKKGYAKFLLDKEIFIVAYADKTSSSTNKYFFRQVTLETFNQFKKKCRNEIFAIY